MESISFCRRKFDAIPFCREMQRRYLAVPKINPKSSDAECSAAPKMRFCEMQNLIFFVVFGKFRKGVEQPVRPPCVPAGADSPADSPADCPQGRGRVPSGAPKMRFCENTKPHLFVIFWKLRPFAQNGCLGLVPSLPAAFDKMQAGGRTANG